MCLTYNLSVYFFSSLWMSILSWRILVKWMMVIVSNHIGCSLFIGWFGSSGHVLCLLWLGSRDHLFSHQEMQLLCVWERSWSPGGSRTAWLFLSPLIKNHPQQIYLLNCPPSRQQAVPPGSVQSVLIGGRGGFRTNQKSERWRSLTGSWRRSTGGTRTRTRLLSAISLPSCPVYVPPPPPVSKRKMRACARVAVRKVGRHRDVFLLFSWPEKRPGSSSNKQQQGARFSGVPPQKSPSGFFYFFWPMENMKLQGGKVWGPEQVKKRLFFFFSRS